MCGVRVVGLGLMSLSKVATGGTIFFSPVISGSDSSILIGTTELSELGFSDLSVGIV